MSEEAKKSPIVDLARAYTKAWAEVQNVVKNAHNPHHKSNYADLSAVIDTVKGVFSKYDLALMQSPGNIVEVGGVLCQRLSGVLIHSSGQSIPMEMMIPLGAHTPDAPDPRNPGKIKKSDINAQKSGGVITYARRYQLAAVAGIAQVDDDGNEASGRGTEEPEYDGKALLKEIESCTELDVLDGTGKGKSFVKSDLRTRVEATEDKKIADAFVAKRDELKAAKKAKKTEETK